MQFFAKAGANALFGGSRTILNGLRCCSGHIQRKNYFKFRVCRALRSAPNAIFTGGVVAGNGSCCACSPGGAVAQRLRGCKSAEPEKTVKRSSRRTGVNLQFFPVEPSSLGLKGASSPFFVAPARRNRCDLAVLNAQHLLRKPVCDLKAPLGLSCLAGTAALFFSFGVKREHSSATTSYPVPPQLPLFLYTLCKKSTGKLRRTSRLTDTIIFFITAKDPTHGSTPRCDGTSAPRREP